MSDVEIVLPRDLKAEARALLATPCGTEYRDLFVRNQALTSLLRRFIGDAQLEDG